MNERADRCPWSTTDELMLRYHDEEWGVPVHDDRKLFEFLVLGVQQAGLSWRTILHKRENFRRALHGFDPERIARYTERSIQRLLSDASIIRNRLKIEATIRNARCFLDVQHEFGSFDAYVWQFVGGTTRHNRWQHISQLPVTTPESDALSRDLKRRGFTFLGSTVCYAYMQAMGMVNDHVTSCFRYRELTK